MLTLPANETYQLAHIATYIASAIARRRAATGRNRPAFRARAQAVRDLAAGREAFGRLTQAPSSVASSQLPQPLDVETFKAARELLSGGPRWAEVVSLAPAGGSGWAMLGHVPALGPVGARVHSQELAEALRQQVMTRPAAELAPWAVTERARRLPVMPHRVDLPAFVADLDPSSPDARAVAAALRGTDQQTDTAIDARFTGIDLDAPAAGSHSTSTPQTARVDAEAGAPADAAVAGPAAAHSPEPPTAAGSAPPAEGAAVPDHGSGTIAGADPADVDSTGSAASRTDRPSPGPRVAAQQQQHPAPATRQIGTQPNEPQAAPQPTEQPGARTAGEQGGQRRVGQPPAQVGGQPRLRARQRRGQPAEPAGLPEWRLDEPKPPGRSAAPQTGSGAQRRADRVKADTRTTYRRPAAAPTQPPRQQLGQAPAAGRS